MPTVDGAPPPQERIQDFIFSRELAEVYLLIDFLSARADKALATVLNGPGVGGSNEPNLLEQVCAIPWPPDRKQPQPNAKTAAILMLAKDQLTSAAKPASGTSIGFSLLVAGDDRTKQSGWFARLRQWWAQPQEDAALEQWNKDPPSRMSLARQAFPGLVRSARRFRFYNRVLIFGLMFWLMVTCILSWNIAAGRSILVRLEAAKSEIAATKKTIASEEDKSALALTASRPEALGAVRFCDRRATGRWHVSDWRVDRYQSAARLCDELEANSATLKNVREDLIQWISTWNRARDVLHEVCGGKGCGTPRRDKAWFSASSDSRRDAPEESIAALLLDVLAGVILPIFYGILGAGAATVRDIWQKMRESLLSPRDLTLSLGQLALGAVVGACIGLFMTPSGGVGQAEGLISGQIALSASGLAFIAGFSVDAVFAALESFVKRIFSSKPVTASA